MSIKNDIAIEVTNLSKKYMIGKNVQGTLRHSIGNIFNKRKRKDEFWALKNIDFSIKQGESIGIIGKNGAGKSTLLKLLSKISFPSGGRIEFMGRVSSLLEVGTGFHPELTGRENIYLNGSLLGMKLAEIQQKFDEIVDFSGVEQFIDTPVKKYSSGMYVRLAFSVAAHLNTDILLVDEVLAVGDAEFQEKCLGKMKEIGSGGRTIVFVSHDEAAIKKLTSKVILLNSGEIEFIGSPDDAFNIYNKTNKFLNFKKYDSDNVVRSVQVKYIDKLVVTVNYEFDYQPIIPHLGIVIKNQEGQILFGTNPTIENIKIDRQYPKKGEIKITVESPRFKYGNYSCSIWMSNGEKDIFHDEDCVGFKVGEKGSLKNFGFIKPICKYEFI